MAADELSVPVKGCYNVGNPVMHEELCMTEVRWERMLPHQLEERFEDCPLLYLSYGLCEPHGPQNAVGLDGLKAHGIACRAAGSHGGIVAPPDYWHIHEIGGYGIWAHQRVGTPPGNPPRTWLSALPPWQHFKNVLYQIRQADALGFKGAILLTGHYGPNWEDLKRLVEIVQPYVACRLYALPDFEANHRGFTGDGSHGGDHAGRVETSLLMAVEPDCVDMSRTPTEPGPHFAMGPDIREADREVGLRMVADEVEWLGKKGKELLADFDAVSAQKRLTTFREVEELWHREVAPRLKDFLTMQESWDWQEEIPGDAFWAQNLEVPDNWT